MYKIDLETFNKIIDACAKAFQNNVDKTYKDYVEQCKEEISKIYQIDNMFKKKED